MLLNVLIGILLIWTVLITWFLYRTILHYNSLIKGTGKNNLSGVLEEILLKQKQTDVKVEGLADRCGRIEENNLGHIQKIGLLRFNPFTDTGGNQSFALSLLNGKNDGLVISSLHSRLQTRWYAKKIKEGRGEENELSEEEKKVLLQAMKKSRI